MGSLKAYIPTLARLLSTTPSALYERQRALVACGLLAPEEGRGPGSGVRATGPSVALLLITILATDSLAETNEMTITVGAAKLADGKCALTQRNVFSHALAVMMMEWTSVARVNFVAVERRSGVARIEWRSGRKTEVSRFLTSTHRPVDLEIEARLSGESLRLITRDVLAMVADGN